jgi:hypothetical protein
MTKKIVNPNGSVTIKVDVPREIWEVFERVGTEIGELGGGFRYNTEPGLVGFNLFLKRFNSQVAAGDLRQVPGPEWQAAVEGRKATLGSLPSGFDRSCLHTDLKRKSGYFGVFTYGYSFQARVRYPNGLGETVLGSYKTAEMAAVSRYHYYLRHETLAYGEAELEVEALRKMDAFAAQKNDVELWPEVVQHLRSTNRYHVVMNPSSVSLIPGPREPQLEAQRRARAEGQTPDTFNATQLVDAARGEGLGAAANVTPEAAVDLIKGLFKPPTSTRAPIVESGPRIAPIGEVKAIGFEDGDLPACFDDDWKPERRKRGRPRKVAR